MSDGAPPRAGGRRTGSKETRLEECGMVQRGREETAAEAAASRSDFLSLAVKYLPTVGPQRAELLANLGIHCVADLLGHFPRRYEDRSKLLGVRDAVCGETQILYGELEAVRERRLRGGRTLVEARLVEAPAGGRPPAGRPGVGAASIQLVWFNQPYLLNLLRPGCRLYVHGQVKTHRGKLQMPAPEFELDTGGGDPAGGVSPHVGRIVPVYALTRGVYQRFLRELVYRVLARDEDFGQGPYDVLFPGSPCRRDAYRSIHFPADWKDFQRARKRFVFEEYFVFATHLFFRRRRFRRGGEARPFQVTEELDQKIRALFPFCFTADQDRVVSEVVRDLRSTRPMYRLLQGDVGTGKTAIALYALLVAVRNGCQGVLMAPTEVLAEQHHRTLSTYLESHPVRVELLTGSVTGAARREIRKALQAGSVHIVVGTHALIQDDIEFRNLAVAVIDEQHRFGVKERMRMRLKGKDPHLLVMTATPIPRSLCMTSYGDLDLSVLRERPEGRQPVSTRLVNRRQRARAMEFIRSELDKGRQAYFIYPLIEESETLALPAAREASETLSRDVFRGYRVGLVHGKMPAAEKERELESFRSGKHQVLVATVVVEVGIDVPNATVLFLEDASRFGLAQLHQLRGRVGRGRHPGYCLVGVEGLSREGRARIQAFASTQDGFRIAEEDLKLRGPGDYMGARQSGRPHFILGNPLEDLDGFLRVKEKADAFWRHEENLRYRGFWAPTSREEEAEVLEGQAFLGLD